MNFYCGTGLSYINSKSKKRDITAGPQSVGAQEVWGGTGVAHTITGPDDKFKDNR